MPFLFAISNLKSRKLGVNFLRVKKLTPFRAKYKPDFCRDEVRLDSREYLRFNVSNMLVSRWRAEQKIGRSLTRDEVVHHIDGDKENNHPVNLHICTPEEHQRRHEDNLRKTGDW